MPNKTTTISIKRRNDKLSERTRARDGTVIVSSNKKEDEAQIAHQQAWAKYRMGKGPKPEKLPSAGSSTKEEHLQKRIENTKKRLLRAINKLEKAQEKIDAPNKLVGVEEKKAQSEVNRAQREVDTLNKLLAELSLN